MKSAIDAYVVRRATCDDPAGMNSVYVRSVELHEAECVIVGPNVDVDDHVVEYVRHAWGEGTGASGFIDDELPQFVVKGMSAMKTRTDHFIRPAYGSVAAGVVSGR